MSRKVPSRCIFFLSTRSAELMSLSRTKTCMTRTHLYCCVPPSRPRQQGSRANGLPLPGSGLLQIDCRGLPLLAALELEAQLLAFMQIAEAGALDGRDVHEHIL